MKLLRTFALQDGTSGFVLVRSVTHAADAAALVAAGLLPAGLSDQR